MHAKKNVAISSLYTDYSYTYFDGIGISIFYRLRSLQKFMDLY